MFNAVGQMRLTPQYKALSDLSKALVDHLVEAVSVNGEPNGGISRTGTELMAAFGIRSRRKLYAAIDAVIDAGIVIRGSRALSLGQDKGASNLWRLARLPDDPQGRAKKRADASPKPNKASSRLRKKGWEKPAGETLKSGRT